MAPPPTPEELAARRAAEQHAAEQAAHAAAQQLAAQQAADQAREAAAQRIAAKEEALRQATERVAAQEAANLQAAEMIAAEKLRMERSLIEPMEVDTSLVFPLPQGTVAQIDFGSSWKTLTGYFDGKAKSSTEVLTLIRNFEQCVTSGNWTQHMAINNFSQILTGTARTWMELLQAYNPRKAKKWDVFKEAFLAEFQSVKNESEAHEQFAKLFQGKNETTRDFSYRVKQTVAVIRKYKAEIPAGATEIQRTVAMMQKQRVEDEINQYFMNGLRPEIKSEMTKQSSYRKMDIDERIDLAMQIEFSMAPKTLPMAEMGRQTTEEPGKEEEENKSMENLTQEEFKKHVAALNRQYNQRFFGGNNQRGNNRGRGRGNNQRGAQSYRGNAWNQGHGNQGGRWNNGNTRGGHQNNFQTNSYNGRGGYQNQNGGRGGYQSQERRRIKCFRCRKFGYHTAQNCPVPNSDLASLTMDEYDDGTPHPYENMGQNNQPLNFQGSRQ